ncbi:ribosomal protein L11 [Jaminaea rosea]|uniref:Large ribosomal subunit protein uL11m n=1 Tax=Jaminaea rosea TaxID=1569628 RepID=A0A316UY16_9BASI|nr:ribosomal protein L11 [Jaminaea rosea]PWN29884.1 ribosomal protein L11 [Jaminaea rosea]
MSKKGGAAAATQLVKLLVPAGKASAQPPVGPALGSKGVKAMDFAKLFNERTAHLEPGLPTPAVITISPDRTFTFTLRTPPTSLLLKRAAGITTGSGRAGSTGSEGVAGTVSVKHIYEIAKIKMADVKGVGEEKMCKVVAGSARSMGIRIVR